MGFIDDAKDKIEDVTEDVKDKTHDATEDSKDWVDDTKENLKDGADEAGEHIDAWMDKSQGEHRPDDNRDTRMDADDLEERTHGRDL